jgi:hypothetical protein
MHKRKHITWSHTHKETYNLISCTQGSITSCHTHKETYNWDQVICFLVCMTSGYMFPLWHHVICFPVCMRSGYMFPCVHDIRLYVSMCIWDQVICFLVCMTSCYMLPNVIHTRKHITWSHAQKETYNLISYTQGNI